MIEGLSNILKFASFLQFQEKPKERKKSNPLSRKRHKQPLQIQISEVCKLIQSAQPIEHWLLQFQIHKHNYIVQHQVYNSIKNRTVSAHNLFIMLIQCKIFDPNIWISIDDICSLEGSRDNQLCCLVHYTVSNMGSKHELNPKSWSSNKTKKQLGNNFLKAFRQVPSLCEKVTILPMMVVINKKNGKFLWKELKWVSNLPMEVMTDLKNNLIKLLRPQLIMNSELLKNLEQNSFFRLMHKKSMILTEVQGFISGKNLFSYTYELYNFPLIFQLLAEGQFEVRLTDFIIQFLQCCETYEFDLTKLQRDNKNLILIILGQKMYLEEIADLNFIKEAWELVNQYNQENCSNNTSFAKVVPRISIKRRKVLQIMDEDEEEDKMIRKLQNDSILSYLLNQLYMLKTGYLRIICQMLQHCYHLEQQPWAMVNSSYYKLQFLFFKYGLLHFLIQHYTALQSNDPETMINYYNCLGYLIRSNPIMYSQLNEILLDFQKQQNYQNKKKKRNQILLFTQSFIKNIIVSRNCVLIILCDQIIWSEEKPQRTQNFFVEEIIDALESEWMISLTSRIIPTLDHQAQEYQWITFLLTIYYYFHEVCQNPSNRFSKQKYLQNLFSDGSQRTENLIEKINQWEDYYQRNLKTPIQKYNLSYPILKMQKEEMLKKIRRFFKRKEFEVKQLPFL